MPKVLHTDFYQKWAGYGICIKRSSKRKLQCMRYSVLQTKVKFMVEAPPLYGLLGVTVGRSKTKQKGPRKNNKNKYLLICLYFLICSQKLNASTQSLQEHSNL